MKSLRISLGLLVAGLLSISVSTADAAVRTWGGGSSFLGNSWSRIQNWTGDTVPGAADVAVFNGTQTANCTIDAAVSVAGMQINSGYSGTITQTSTFTITVDTSDYTQSAGTFVGGSGTFTVNNGGRFILNAGTFTAPSSTLSVGYQISIPGGTFNHNNGTVQLWNLPQSATSILNAPGVTFYNLIFRGWGNSPNQLLTNTCTVLNLLSNINEPGNHWQAGVTVQGPASITLLGSFIKTNSTMTFDIPLVFTNAADQTIGVYEGSVASALTINKPTGTVYVVGLGLGTVSGGDITLSGGALVDTSASLTRGVVILTNAGTYTVTNCVNPSFYGDFLVYSNASFKYATSGFLSLGGPADAHKLLITNGTFSVTGGALQLDDMLNYGTLNLGTADFVVQLGATPGFRAGGSTFSNFTYNCRGNRTMTLMDDLVIVGDLVTEATSSSWFGNVTPSGIRKITLSGSFTQTNCVSTFGNANLTLQMTGTNKTLTLAAGSFNANLAISNNAVVSSTRDFICGSPATVYANATLNLAGHNFSASAITVGGTLRLQGGETVSPAPPTLNTGSTVRYDGAGSPVTVQNWPYRKLDLSAPGKQFNWTAGTTCQVAEAFIADGTLISNVLLRSTTPGSYSYLSVTNGAAEDVKFVDVQDSNAGGGQSIIAIRSLNSGNNVNWFFPAVPGFLLQLR